MRHVLFLCSRNKWRSPTAEDVFADRPGIEVDSAGLNSGADVLISEEQVEWADVILVMEPKHRVKLNKNFGHLLASKQVGVLNIPDDYQFMDPDLIDLLEKRCAHYLPRT